MCSREGGVLFLRMCVCVCVCAHTYIRTDVCVAVVGNLKSK